MFFFIFLGVAFMLDKSFSGEDDPDVLEVHRHLEARFGQPVAIEGPTPRAKRSIYTCRLVVYSGCINRYTRIVYRKWMYKYKCVLV